MEKQILEEIEKMRRDLIDVKSFMSELDTDIHLLRESYIEKLKKIKKDGTIDQEKFEKELEIKV